MYSSGLSLEQSPPFSASLRFFITGLFFILIAAIILCIFPIDIFERWGVETIGVLHFFNLGFLLMIIMGALTQMLPVLAGSPIPHVLWFARIIHFLMTIGALFFPLGLIKGNQFLLSGGAVCVWFGVCSFFSYILWCLRKSLPGFSVTCFKLGALSALIMILFAGRLALSWCGIMEFPLFHLEMVELHIAWAIFGVIFTLIIGISHKVIPMFYVTSDYPELYTKFISKLIFGLLICWSGIFVLVSFEKLSWLFKLVPFIKSLLSILVLIYSFETFKRFSSRKRILLDTTILYWKTSMIFFSLGSILYFIIQYWFTDTKLEVVAAVFMGIGFLSIITGMIYKIIPFLTWFHLTALKIKKVPTMRELLPDRFTRLQYYLHQLAVLFLILTIFIPNLKIVFILALGASTLVALILIIFFPIREYRRQKRAITS